MANWGAGITAGMQAGLNTYGKTRQYMDEDKERREKEEREALSKGAFSKVGTDQVDAQQANMGSANPDEYQPATKQYTDVDAHKEYASGLAKAGQFEQAAKARATGTALETGDLNLKRAKRDDVKGERDADNEKKHDDIFKWQQRMNKEPKFAITEMQRIYNEGKGDMNDGHTADYVDMADETGKTTKLAVFKDKKGNIVGNAMPVTSQAIFQFSRDEARRRAGGVDQKGADAYEAYAARKFEQEMAANRDNRDAAGETRAAALHPGQLKQQDATLRSTNASTSASNAAARNSRIMGDIAQSGLDAIKENKPLLAEYEKMDPKQQQGPEGQALIHRATVRQAIATGRYEQALKVDRPLNDTQKAAAGQYFKKLAAIDEPDPVKYEEAVDLLTEQFARFVPGLENSGDGMGYGDARNKDRPPKAPRAGLPTRPPGLAQEWDARPRPPRQPIDEEEARRASGGLQSY